MVESEDAERALATRLTSSCSTSQSISQSAGTRPRSFFSNGFSSALLTSSAFNVPLANPVNAEAIRLTMFQRKALPRISKPMIRPSCSHFHGFNSRISLTLSGTSSVRQKLLKSCLPEKMFSHFWNSSSSTSRQSSNPSNLYRYDLLSALLGFQSSGASSAAQTTMSHPVDH